MPEWVLKPLAGAVFALVYLAIASERIDKTKAALVGAALMLTLGVVSQHDAFGHHELAPQIIRDYVREVGDSGVDTDRLAAAARDVRGVPGADWNTIFLLVGMMIVVGITRRTGVFQWLAIRCAKLAKGDPVRILVLLSTVTAVVSAGLDNVTTVLLIAPVTLVVAETLGVTPFPFLLCEILASNIGGTATLIGDPPNIIIGSKAGLSFMDFVYALTPAICLAMVVFLVTVWLLFRRRLVVPAERRQEIMELDERRAITDHRLLRRSLAVIALILAGFGLHSQLGWEPATVALSGAAVLFLVCGIEAEEVFHDIEWPTIFFFLGLFIMVGGLVKVGIIGDIARVVVSQFKDSQMALVSTVLWGSAFASAIVDNIPYTMAMSEVVVDMAHSLPQVVPGLSPLHQPEVMTLWWTLALGACLGGNGTLIGASANVVVAGIAKRAGYPITFVQFLKYGLPLMVQSVLVSWVYLWLRYLRVS